MKLIHKILIVALSAGLSSAILTAQTTSTAKLRRSTEASKAKETSTVSNRKQNLVAMPSATPSELGWTRVIYRSLDLNKPANSPLYYPEPPMDGQENLFRKIFNLVTTGQVKAYEYLDGRELFTSGHELKVNEMLDRFHIPYKESKSARQKKQIVEDTDVPAEEVQSYYIIERYEFDKKNTRMRTVIDAICPVLHRTDDWGIDPLKYPMFWVKFSDLQPYLNDADIFVSDQNNIPTYSYHDYFLLGLYDGEIVKTRNPLNKSLAELYPDKEALKHVQDSIERSLEGFGDRLWAPSLEELQQRRERRIKAEILAAGGDTTKVKDSIKAINTKRGAKKQNALKIKTKRAKTQKSSSSSAATRSVRNRKR